MLCPVTALGVLDRCVQYEEQVCQVVYVYNVPAEVMVLVMLRAQGSLVPIFVVAPLHLEARGSHIKPVT